VKAPSFRRLGISIAVLLALAISVGGGSTYIALELTTTPQFCRNCHNMEPYYDSWESSSHSHVNCVDCHYEPGLLETFEGKFKALSQLAKYVTRTEGTKPWAEVSDYSCMRSGCHSTRLLEGELQFGRIRFDHRHHLIDLRRGKKLRCTSCHSQIVQGSHLTVTTSSCFLCHFRGSDESKPIDDCSTCHGPPKEEIQLGGFVFRHSDYLERGVECESCHGDITRGTGEVPRTRCDSCHNVQAHLDRYGDVEFLHRHHVTDHSVSCLECHTEIEHGLPSREEHFQSDCGTCHVGTHGAGADVYRGTGGRHLADDPSVMFLARVTCNGCHRPPFPGAPAPQGGDSYKADPLACIDCHGPGYEGMAERWQAEARSTIKKVESALGDLKECLNEEWEEADLPEAKRRYEAAAHNFGMVLLDRSDGVHNLPYVRSLLHRAHEDIRAGMKALDPEEELPRLATGPKTKAKEGCTVLCHVGVEQQEVKRAFELPFDHKAHLLRARLDCSRCHASEPHGTTTLRPKDCRSCHHEAEEAKACGACHVEVADLRKQEAGDPMQDLDCISCHESVADDPSPAAIRQACDECHEDEKVDYEAWKESGIAPLREVESLLETAAPEKAAEARAELGALYKAGAHHNVAHARATAERLRALLDKER
jgi:nitrate/TMAO reductase-like tetraheme cytochrome c subunit